MTNVDQRLVRWLFVVFALKQLVWVAFIPPWQFPDEQAHFAQVQNVAERKSSRPFNGPNTSREIYESEILLGTNRDGFGNNKFTYHSEFKLLLTETVTNEVEEAIKKFPVSYRQEMVIYEATVYPPLYYLLAAPTYWVTYGNDLLTRIFTVRLVNLPIFLLIIFFVKKIGKLLFGKQNFLTVLLMLFVGFHPMFSYVSAGTTSDNLYHLLSTIVIFLSLQLVRRGLSWTWVVATATSSLLLWWTKPQSKLMYLVLVSAVLFALKTRQKMSRPLIAILVVLLVATFGYGLTQFIAGVQFLPEITSWDKLIRDNLSIVSHLRWTLTHTYREVLPWYWGVFRWLSLTYPRPIHRIINWSMLFSLIGLTLFILNRRKSLSVSKSKVWFLGVANLIYFFGLFAFDYLFTRTHQFSFGIQGRYYFPLTVTQMALLIVGFYSLLRLIPFGQVLLKVFGIAMVTLHLYAQAFVTVSYLSPTSLSSFFQQASQYKPFFFKSPFLELLTGLYLVSLLLFLWYYMRALRGKGEVYEERRR